MKTLLIVPLLILTLLSVQASVLESEKRLPITIKAVDCFPDYQCESWGPCTDGLESRKCNDTKCGRRDIIERRFCGGEVCKPIIRCTDWTQCIYTEKTEDLLGGQINFGGYQNRLCVDAEGCVDTYAEERPCEETFDLAITKATECGREFVVITDTISNKRVAKIDLESYNRKRLDITFTQDKARYCPTCYNTKKDLGEEKTDCGGDCKPCVEERGLPLWPFIISFWTFSALSFALAVKEYLQPRFRLNIRNKNKKRGS